MTLGAETVDLCPSCHAVAPEDPYLLRHLFLRFATRKEFLRAWETEDEREALRGWAAQEGLALRRLGGLLAKERSDMGLLRTPNPLAGMLPTRTPYGYAWKGAHLVPAPLEAAVVREIFELAREGRSLDEIRRSLNRQETPTPRGGRWHRSTLRYLLRNPLYAGYRRRRGLLYEGTHPALVPPRVFRQVGARLSQRIRRPDQRPQAPVSAPRV